MRHRKVINWTDNLRTDSRAMAGTYTYRLVSASPHRLQRHTSPKPIRRREPVIQPDWYADKRIRTEAEEERAMDNLMNSIRVREINQATLTRAAQNNVALGDKAIRGWWERKDANWNI